MFQITSLKHLWQRLATGSVNRKIFGAACIVGIFTILVKIVSLAKELAVAAVFGTSDALDAFLIAILIPSFLVTIIAGSFNAALIPAYFNVLKKEGISAARRLLSNVITVSFLLLCGATVILVVCAPLFLPWIATGFNPAKLRLTYHLFLLTSPLLVLSGMIAIFGAVLNAHERFVLAALSPAITPALTVLLLFLLVYLGIFALAVSLVVGLFLESAVLLWTLKQEGVFLGFKWRGIDPHLSDVLGQYAPMAVGSLLISSTVLVDQVMAAMLPSGSVAALNYGSKVVAFPLGLFAAALGTGVLPYFSKMTACQDWSGVRHTLKRYLALIFAVTVPVTLFFTVLASPVARILFERGSFTPQDTDLVGRMIALFSFQIPFYASGVFIVRLISSLRANHILMWGASISFLLNVVLNYLLMQAMGVSGIALSTSIVYLVSFIYLIYFTVLLIRKNEGR